jgi:hypothetical protein
VSEEKIILIVTKEGKLQDIVCGKTDKVYSEIIEEVEKFKTRSINLTNCDTCNSYNCQDLDAEECRNCLNKRFNALSIITELKKLDILKDLKSENMWRVNIIEMEDII